MVEQGDLHCFDEIIPFVPSILTVVVIIDVYIERQREVDGDR
jgi:hypothetical protein